MPLYQEPSLSNRFADVLAAFQRKGAARDGYNSASIHTTTHCAVPPPSKERHRKVASLWRFFDRTTFEFCGAADCTFGGCYTRAGKLLQDERTDDSMFFGVVCDHKFWPIDTDFTA
jgi:hypothetical protein